MNYLPSPGRFAAPAGGRGPVLGVPAGAAPFAGGRFAAGVRFGVGSGVSSSIGDGRGVGVGLGFGEGVAVGDGRTFALVFRFKFRFRGGRL